MAEDSREIGTGKGVNQKNKGNDRKAQTHASSGSFQQN